VEKDTVTFAIFLSVIDFVLSCVLISGIGVVLALLPYLNRLGKLDEESMRRGH
jgi:energy-converting hydrogenase Eha subunit G